MSATGTTVVSPNRRTTMRQMQHFGDNMKRIEADREKKAALRADLER